MSICQPLSFTHQHTPTSTNVPVLSDLHEQFPHPTTFTYESDFLSLPQFIKLIKRFKKKKIPTCKARIISQSKQIIQMLAVSLTKNGRMTPKQPIRKKQYYYILSQQQYSNSQAKQRKYKKIIDLNCNTTANAFINQYRTQLKILGQQFKLYMIKQGYIIKVYSDRQISPLFQSQIITMKQKLKTHIFSDSELYTKLKYSQFVRDSLQKMEVKFLLLRNQLIMLHSASVGVDFLKSIRNTFMYQALILQFQSHICSRMINRLYFKMLMYHCKPVLEKISSNYEINSEISWRRMGIIVHTRDPIFSSQPKMQLSNFLNRIIFISYYTTSPAKHIDHIRTHKPKSPCLQIMMSNLFVYTSWNTNMPIKPTEVTKIFKKLFAELQLKSVIRISFRTGGLSKEVLQNVQDLVEKYKLFCEKPQYAQNNEEVLHVKFKSFHNQQKKRLQLLYFLQQLLTGKFEEQLNISKKSAKDNKQKIAQNQQSKSNQDNSKESNSGQGADDENDLTNNEVILSQITRIEQYPSTEELNSLCFKYLYQIPQIIVKNIDKESENSGQQKTQFDIIIQKGKRNRKMQQFLLKQNFIAKIWNIKLVTSQQKYQKLQFLQQVSNKTQFSMYIIERNYNTNEIKFNMINPLQLNYEKLQLNKEYYLVAQTNQQNYILTHVMQKI